MPAPTNTTSGTAVDITALPYSIAQNVHDAGTTYTVWYKYTATADDNVLGLWGYGTIGSGYQPTTAIFSPDAVSLYMGTAVNKPFQIQVTAGDTYWFRFTTSAGNPTPAVLTLNLQRHEDLPITRGQIAVPDDTSPFPLSLLSRSVEFQVDRFIQGIPSSEHGDILPNGISAIDRKVTGGIIIYDSSFATLATVAGATGGVVSVRRSVLTNTFFCTPTANIVSQIDTDGTVLDTWTPTGPFVTTMVVSPDETVLYYTQVLQSAIYRWDLINDVALSNLVTLPSVPSQRDPLCMTDGSVIVLLPSSNLINRYSAAGALLNAYTMPVTVHAQDHLAYDLSDDHFWVWQHDTGLDYDQFFKVRLSDGVIVETVNNTEYNSGIYNATATLTPSARFGHSHSCPFFIITQTPIPDPPGPIPSGPPGLEELESQGILRVIPTVRQRRTPHTSDLMQRFFVSYYQLDIQPGVGIPDGQGEDPKVEIRWSNDGGFTWGNGRTMTLGRQGNYQHRAITWQCGMARDRVVEVTMSDPVPAVWADLYFGVDESTQTP